MCVIIIIIIFLPVTVIASAAVHYPYISIITRPANLVVTALTELDYGQALSWWCSLPVHCNECLRCLAHRASVLTNVLVLVSILHVLVLIVADLSWMSELPRWPCLIFDRCLSFGAHRLWTVLNVLAAAFTACHFWWMSEFSCSSSTICMLQ